MKSLNGELVMIFLVVGYGLIGRQRTKAILDSGLAQEIYIYDPFLNDIPIESENLTRIGDISDLKNNRLSHVLIATPHDQVTGIIDEVKIHKPRIFIEKPMGRNLLESEKIRDIAKECDISVGFNYRFMAGIEKLKKIIASNEIGAINSIRLDLGHGGSPEDGNSWKLNKELAGGGSLLDPGIHLIDLILYLFGKNSSDIEVDGVNYWSGFWKTGIEESSMVLGKIDKIPFNLISSIVAWKTRFMVEVIGVNGYVIINGRGRSDGPQTITIGQRWGWLHATSQLESELTSNVMFNDTSILNETKAWINQSHQVCTAEQAFKSMSFYQKILDKKAPNGI